MRTPWAIPGAAALWTAVEYAHGTIGLAWIGLGFAWLDLGNAGIDMPLLPRLAPITGVCGLSFVLAMIGCALALAVLRRPRRTTPGSPAWRCCRCLPALPPPHAGTERVRVVQPNIDTEAEWTPETHGRAPAAHGPALRARRRAADRVAGGSRAVLSRAIDAFRKYVADLARDAHAPFLFGGVGRTPAGAPLNSAFLFERERRDGGGALRQDPAGALRRIRARMRSAG